MPVILDLQLASDTYSLPGEDDISRWLGTVLARLNIEQAEITVRIVDEEESQQLNHEYRGKNKPTNVLSFPFEAPAEIELDFIGDLVICAPVVMKEASEQNKAEMHHWAHMIIHGCLHLLGYDHLEESDAQEMESIEINLLQQLDIDDPYQDIE